MVEICQPSPLLSICIPTYNRPSQFLRLAKCICIQKRLEQIEIIIRDDSPNEETRQITEEILIPSGIPVKYFQGDKIGLDAANIFLIENATGAFVWWFGDDDEMRAGAVENVINLIESDKELKYIWANFDFETEGNSVVDTSPRYFTSGDDILTTLGVNIGLVSTHIMHRETALESVQLARSHFLGFGFAGLIPVLKIITGPGRFYLLGKPYILCNPTKIVEIILLTNKNGEINNKGFDVYGVHFHHIINLFKGQFSNKSIRGLLTKNFASLWRGMLVGWVGGWDTPQGKRIRMLKLYWKYPECWIAIPLFCMPLPVVKVSYQLYKIFFEHRKFIFHDKFQSWLRK